MPEKKRRLIEYITRLTGIGPRQATRLVLALLEWSPGDIQEFSNALVELKQGPLLCSRCHNFTDGELCGVCKNARRNQNHIAVVERVTDLQAIEKTGIWNGVYHVLGGAINPAGGMPPDKLRFRELLARVQEVKEQGAKDIEVILATNPNTYGETTALYAEQELKPLNVNVTRLARGLAAGSTVEYADEITLANALKNRK